MMLNHSQKKVLREQYRSAAHAEYRRGDQLALERVPVTKAETAAKKLLGRIAKQRQQASESYRKRSNEIGEKFNFAIEFKDVNECLALIKKRRELK
jgi:hypothetical protein